MLAERALRDLSAPGTLAGSLLLGCLIFPQAIDNIHTFTCERGLKVPESALLAAALGGATLGLLGFVMSTATLAFLRLARWLGIFDWEVPVSREVLQKMQRRLNIRPVRRAPNQDWCCRTLECLLRKFWFGPCLWLEFQPVVSIVEFQRRFWPEVMLRWAERRWLAIGACANAVCGVLAGIIFGSLALDWCVWSWWGAGNGIAALCFLIQGGSSWCEVRQMCNRSLEWDHTDNFKDNFHT